MKRKGKECIHKERCSLAKTRTAEAQRRMRRTIQEDCGVRVHAIVVLEIGRECQCKEEEVARDF